MKRKSSLIITVLLILILTTIVGILIVLKNNQSRINMNSKSYNQSENEEDISEEVDAEIEVNRDINYEVSRNNYMIYPKNIQEIFTNNRVGIITETDFAKTLFNFVYDDIEKIYEETKNLNDDEILKYYKINQIDIEKYHIFDEQDFYSISKEINNIKANNQNAIYSSCEIDVSSKKETDENMTFNILINFDNEKSINMQVYLSKTVHKIAFEKEFSLEEMFKKYSGEIDEASFRKFIYTFENTNIQKINDLAKQKSFNDILKQYDEQKELINSFGIYDANDYLEIANQIIKVRWSRGASIKNYTVDEASLQNNGKYTSFNVTINYTTSDTITVKIGIANKVDQEPQFIVAKA